MDEAAITALFVQMLRAGAIDDEMIHNAAAECEASGDDMAAHQLRCLIVGAEAAPATEVAKLQRRASLRSIDGGNGS